MKDPARTTLAHSVYDRELADPHEKGKLTKYSEVVNYILDTYATVCMFANGKAEITNFKQSKYISAVI